MSTLIFVLPVGCLKSHQQASISHGLIYLTTDMLPHGREVADQTLPPSATPYNIVFCSHQPEWQVEATAWGQRWCSNTYHFGSWWRTSCHHLQWFSVEWWWSLHRHDACKHQVPCFAAEFSPLPFCWNGSIFVVFKWTELYAIYWLQNTTPIHIKLWECVWGWGQSMFQCHMRSLLHTVISLAFALKENSKDFFCCATLFPPPPPPPPSPAASLFSCLTAKFPHNFAP